MTATDLSGLVLSGGVVLVAFDDTDSRAGGCTTHTALEFVRGLEDVDLIGPARLVRLNPTIPHKTRGNGAVCLRLGHGRGTPQLVGWDGGRPLQAYAEGEELAPAEAERMFKAARRLIQDRARLESARTHPGLAMFDRPPSRTFYEAAVSRYVGMAEAERCLAEAVDVAVWKEGRGRLGATAAAAWPAERVTYEWIAYREPERWGSRRDLDPGLGPDLDRGHPTTFDNYDAANRHLRIAPASPCPILAGIRGLDVADLRRAMEKLGPERSAASLLFATNQASDDQFRAVQAGRVRPYTSPVLDLRVAGAPRTWRGGHVFVRACDASGEVDLVAYEPTKAFRDVVRALRPGDAVRAFGSVQADPRLVALERLEVCAQAPRRRRGAPLCVACDRRMRSRGRGDGYRCTRCGNAEAAQVEVRAADVTGRFEVPVCVRRHLTRPLRLADSAAA